MNYFDIWTKVVRSVGLEELAFSDVYDEQRVANGHKLLKIKRSTRQRQLSGAASTAASYRDFELNYKSSDDDGGNNENDESVPLL